MPHPRASARRGSVLGTVTGGPVIGPERKPGRRLALGRQSVKPGRRLGRGRGGRKVNLLGVPEIPSIGGGGTGGGKRTRR